MPRFHQIVVLLVFHRAFRLEETLGAEIVMKEKIKELLSLIAKKKKLSELEESNIRQQIISLELEDDYFMNREKRRVKE